MIDGLDKAREQSLRAETAFRQKVAELNESLECFPKLSILEVANGSVLINPDRTYLFEHRKVGPDDALKAVQEIDPDIILIDGDDLRAVGVLSELGGSRAAKMVLMSRESVRDIVPSVQNVRHIIFRPVGEGELIDIIGCLRPETH